MFSNYGYENGAVVIYGGIYNGTYSITYIDDDRGNRLFPKLEIVQTTGRMNLKKWRETLRAHIIRVMTPRHLRGGFAVHSRRLLSVARNCLASSTRHPRNLVRHGNPADYYWVFKSWKQKLRES